MRRGDQSVEREPGSVVGAEVVAVRAAAQIEVDDARRAGPRRQRREQLVGVAAMQRPVFVGDGGADHVSR